MQSDYEPNANKAPDDSKPLNEWDAINQLMKQSYNDSGFSNYAGRYDIHVLGKNEGSFLVWDTESDKQVTNANWDWNRLFKQKPYFEKTIPRQAITAYRFQ
jgi:hypothetical protein